MKDLDASRLHQLLDYNVETGVFRWKVRPCNRVKIGAEAGRVTESGYRVAQLDGQMYQLPRLAWLYINGSWPKSIIRFIDGNPLNCRIENLKDTYEDTLGLKYRDQIPEDCHPDLMERHRDGKRAYARNWSLKKAFGISLLDYQDMFVAQNGVCAICGNPEGGVINERRKWLAVDHDHKTNEVRGLLCESCNKAIGLMQDSIERLTSAIAYLKKYGTTNAASPDNVVTLVKEHTGLLAKKEHP